MSASRIAAARMPQDLYQGRASRFVMWKRGDLVFLFMALSSQLSHHHADLALFRAATDEEATAQYLRCEEILAETAANVYIQDLADLVAVRKGLSGYRFYPLYAIDLSTVTYT